MGSHHSTMDKKVKAYGMKRAEKKAKEEGKNSWGTKWKAIISCTSSDGCLEKYSDWSKENPTQIWYEYRNKKSHWSYILQNKRLDVPPTNVEDAVSTSGVTFYEIDAKLF